MATQTTLVLLKPDAVQRGYIGDILSRFERKGLTLVGLRMVKADETLAGTHYEVHKDRPFYPALIKFITSSPLVAVALRGDEAVSVVRTLMGPTDGRKAAPGTVRGDFGCSIGANLVHGSDSEENAAIELGVWFPEGVIDWQRCDEPWLDAD
jgi:nucleoside-diphosphate kinase